MAKKYLNAVKQAKLHEEDLVLVNEDLPIALVLSWEAKITTWENNRTSPNPYYTPKTSTYTHTSDEGFTNFWLQVPQKMM